MTDAPRFERLAVVGLGLVGGSVALGARARGLVGEIRGVDPHLDDAGPIPLGNLEEVVPWADGVVLAVPVDAIESVVERIAPRLAPGTILTDTASVKGPMARAARRFLPDPGRCVGAHPMAGGDASGFAYARADLFQGAPCILTPEGTEPGEVVDRVDQFWQGLGTFTVRMTPQKHDAVTAVLSHAPHVIAFAFAQGLPDAETLRLAGPGLRDFVRIARGNPGLWCEILLMNRWQVTEEIAQFEKNLTGISEALARGDREALERALRRGHAAVEDLER
jgi:prephenate dehydrogenase